MTRFCFQPIGFVKRQINENFFITFLYMNIGLKKKKLLKLHDESISYILNDVYSWDWRLLGGEEPVADGVYVSGQAETQLVLVAQVPARHQQTIQPDQEGRHLLRPQLQAHAL